MKVWTDERTNKLKKLWFGGKTHSQIAIILGDGLTRLAVSGKINQMGWNGRTEGATPRARKVKEGVPRYKQLQDSSAVPARAERVVALSVPQSQEIEVPSQGPTVLTIAAHMCRWPIGDPLSSSFRFCGLQCKSKGPYCNDHSRDAYHHSHVAKGMRSTGTELTRFSSR